MDFVAQIETQASLMRSAAVKAGPAAAVPSCPEWTVIDLVRHQAGVHAWAAKAAVSRPGDERPEFDRVPEDWDEAMAWWEERTAALVSLLRATPPDTACWTFDDSNTIGFWARRQAHETAIHRLDAELAVSHDVPALLFDSDFAADGIDEFLTIMLPRRLQRGGKITTTGRLLLHAADAGRAWEVRLAADSAPVVGPVTDSAIDEDATVAGTADAIYRALWGRPSHAIVSGDRALLDELPRP